MAMDKTTTRRMIGAIVLVLVAALVLAYLLKSKNSNPEVEKVHDITLPSSPILQFPGDGSASDAAAAEQNADQKVGLGVRPDGLKPAEDAASKAQQTATDGLKVVGGSASQDAPAQNSGKSAVDAKQDIKVPSKPKADSRLKEADVLTLDNGNKVSSGKNKSNDDKEQKKSSRDKPRLVGEKKLPKHSDQARRDKAKKEAKAKKDAAAKKAAKAKKDAAEEESVASEAAPTTGFSVQLLATGSESKAKSVKAQMVAEGYPAYTTSVIKNGKTLYRLRIGSYQDREEAESVQARMKRRYTQNSNVQNSMVVAN